MCLCVFVYVCVSQAGKYYAKCGEYHKALSLFLQCGDKMLDEAIRVCTFAHTAYSLCVP